MIDGAQTTTCQRTTEKIDADSKLCAAFIFRSFFTRVKETRQTKCKQRTFSQSFSFDKRFIQQFHQGTCTPFFFATLTHEYALLLFTKKKEQFSQVIRSLDVSLSQSRRRTLRRQLKPPSISLKIKFIPKARISYKFWNTQDQLKLLQDQAPSQITSFIRKQTV